MVTVPAVVYPMPGDGNTAKDIQLHHGSFAGGSDLFPKTQNQPVVSMVQGKVIQIWTQAQAPLSGGNAVLIEAPNGLQYYYAHLAGTPLVSKGQTVKAGQQLGIAGNTGNASGTGVHLHLGIGYGIIDGLGPTGGAGKGFDAVSYLKSVIQTGNLPQLATQQGQLDLQSGQLSPAIQPPLASLNKPADQSIEARVKWLAQLLYAAGLEPTKIPALVAISLAEDTTSDPNAVSPTGDYGLFQINCKTWLSALGLTDCNQLKNPMTNAMAAIYVWQHSANGLNAWTTHQAGIDNLHIPKVNTILTGSDYQSGITPGDVWSPGGSDDGDDQTGSDSPQSECRAACGEWQLGSLAGQSLHIPDLGCVMGCTMTDFVTETKDRWNAWLASKEDMWWTIGFAVAGALILIVGLLQLEEVQGVAMSIVAPEAKIAKSVAGG
jgi:hypothetical protein